MCEGHQTQRKSQEKDGRTWSPTPIHKPGTCTAELEYPCTRAMRCGGLCKSHYAAKRLAEKAGQVRVPKPLTFVFSADASEVYRGCIAAVTPDCAEKPGSGGLCEKHKPRVHVAQVPRELPAGTRRCSTGCGRPAPKRADRCEPCTAILSRRTTWSSRGVGVVCAPPRETSAVVIASVSAPMTGALPAWKRSDAQMAAIPYQPSRAATSKAIPKAPPRAPRISPPEGPPPEGPPPEGPPMSDAKRCAAKCTPPCPRDGDATDGLCRGHYMQRYFARKEGRTWEPKPMKSPNPKEKPAAIATPPVRKPLAPAAKQHCSAPMTPACENEVTRGLCAFHRKQKSRDILASGKWTPRPKGASPAPRTSSPKSEAVATSKSELTPATWPALEEVSTDALLAEINARFEAQAQQLEQLAQFKQRAEQLFAPSES